MNQKNGRTDPGPLRERARSLFISQATIDETLEWATPRQLAAIDRMLATELANREASKRARLMRQARFPVPKSLDGYDFANVRLPDGYTKEQPAGLDFAAKAQDLVFYGKTGRGKTHLATALGMLAVERGRSCLLYTSSAGSFSADNGKIAVGEFHADAEFPSNAALDDVNQDGDGTLYSGLYFGQCVHNLSSTPDFPRVASMRCV